MKVISLGSREELAAALKKNKLVVVMFGASFCGHCKNIAPLFEMLSEEKEMKKIFFAKVECGQAKDLARDEKITGFPTFKFYRKGRERFSFAGADPDNLKSKLRELKEL